MDPRLVDAEELEHLVTETYRSLPDWVRDAVQDVAVMIEDVPAREAMPAHGTLLGRYEGIPLAKRGFRVPGSFPDRIVLYRIPLARVSPTREALAERVRTVLLHEIGHAMGMSEERLRELGVA